MISDTNGEQPISNMIAGVINKVRSDWFKILNPAANPVVGRSTIVPPVL